MGNKVKALLVLAGISQSDIVKKLGVDKGDVSKVISGQRKTQRIRREIAKILCCDVYDLFDEKTPISMIHFNKIKEWQLSI